MSCQRPRASYCDPVATLGTLGGSPLPHGRSAIHVLHQSQPRPRELEKTTAVRTFIETHAPGRDAFGTLSVLSHSIRVGPPAIPSLNVCPDAVQTVLGCGRCQADAALPTAGRGLEGHRTSPHARIHVFICQCHSPLRGGRSRGHGDLGYTHIPTTCFQTPPRAGIR